ncbi:MAG TPA: hypothetical protein VJS43_01155 [Candidatus Acidoferrales bacterium]|nr:hypothetical protein [Candidatus Acidoferrales bacterium]
MAISIELNEISDAETRHNVEGVVRGCIGDSANEKDWKVWIYSGSVYCRVVIQGASQSRERFFFEQFSRLPDSIRKWMEAYPLM